MMEPKNPPNRRAPQGARRPPRLAAIPGLAGPVVLDFIQGRIEAFNRQQGGGMAVSKDRHRLQP